MERSEPLPTDKKTGSLNPTRRSSVAELVFEQLATAILSGEYPAGSTLPSERTLAEELSASRVLVRQAIHRLNDLRMVRVRQGAPTLVLDLSDAAGLGYIELAYRYGDSLTPALERALIERQYENGGTLLRMASRAPLELRERVVEAASGTPDASFNEYERRFWLAVAEAGGNAISIAELRWWYDLIGEHMPRPESVKKTPLSVRVAFHREVAHRLASGEDAVSYYWSVVEPILSSLASA